MSYGLVASQKRQKWGKQPSLNGELSQFAILISGWNIKIYKIGWSLDYLPWFSWYTAWCAATHRDDFSGGRDRWQMSFHECWTCNSIPKRSQRYNKLTWSLHQITVRCLTLGKQEAISIPGTTGDHSGSAVTTAVVFARTSPPLRSSSSLNGIPGRISCDWEAICSRLPMTE